MNLTFDADKYASGAVSINFQGIVKNQDTVSYISIVLTNGDNEISDLEADALKRRSDYGQLIKDGVFEEDREKYQLNVKDGVFSLASDADKDLVNAPFVTTRTASKVTTPKATTK